MEKRSTDASFRQPFSKTIALSGWYAIPIVCGLMSRCASTAVPPALTDAQRAALSVRPCADATVGIEPYHLSIYSARLNVALRATHRFRTVAPITAFDEPPTFVARVTRPIYGSALIPWKPALTFGLISMTVQEEHGYSFSLTPTTEPTHVSPVEFSYVGPSTLGWRALLINVRGDGISSDVYSDVRMYDNLAWTITAMEKRLCTPSDDATSF
jgi:hypothetical protein